MRSKLAEKGIQIDAIYKGELTNVFSGGIRKRRVYSGNFDFKTSLNFESLVGWKGASGFFYLLGDHGRRPTFSVGDAQGTSNIEAPADTVKVYEAWLQQAFLDERASILVGLHDLNSEFYVTETSSLFLNSSFGVGKEFSQSGLNGPSIFPVTSAAVRVRVEPTKSFYLQTAVFDAVSGNPSDPKGTWVKFDDTDGLLIVSELAYLRGKEEKSTTLYGKYGMGMWTYTKTFNHLTKLDAGGGALQATSHGMYFIAEQTLIDPLAVFLRYGLANSEVNRFHSNLSYGFVLTGLLPTRDMDRFGFAVTTASNGSEYQTQQLNSGVRTDDSETAIEVSYKFQMYRGVAIQPDFQYVVHPSTITTRENAVVGVLRFEVAL